MPVRRLFRFLLLQLVGLFFYPSNSFNFFVYRSSYLFRLPSYLFNLLFHSSSYNLDLLFYLLFDYFSFYRNFWSNALNNFNDDLNFYFNSLLDGSGRRFAALSRRVRRSNDDLVEDGLIARALSRLAVFEGRALPTLLT